MAKNAEAIHVALDCNVYVADVGATEPDNTWDFDNDSLEDVGWRELGWNTKAEGVNLTFSRTTVDIEGQGSLDPLRTLVTGAPKTVTVTFLEMSFGVWDFATGGADSNTLAAGLYEIVPLPPSTLAERALAFLFTDGEEHILAIYRRGIVTGDTTIPFTDTDAAKTPVTFSVLTPGDQSEAYRIVHDIDELAFAGS